MEIFKHRSNRGKHLLILRKNTRKKQYMIRFT